MGQACRGFKLPSVELAGRQSSHVAVDEHTLRSLAQLPIAPPALGPAGSLSAHAPGGDYDNSYRG